MATTSVSPTSPPSDLLSREMGIAFCIAFLLEMVAIIIGNSIAIGAFTRGPRQLRKRSYYLLLNLAVADLLTGGFSVALRVYFLPKQFDLWNLKLNPKMVMAYVTVSSFVEGASLAMISFERMYAIVWPLKHRTLPTKVYYVFIGLVWCFACIMPAFHIAKYLGWISHSTKFVILLSFRASFLLLISINYIAIWAKCRFGATTHRMASARERRLAKSLFLTTFVSMVTLLPAPIIFLYQRVNPGIPLKTKRLMYMPTIPLFYANSLVNPIIYSFRIPLFREYALQHVCKRPVRERTEEINMQDL